MEDDQPGEGEVRMCYICLDSVSAELLQAEADQWVSPCLCAGSMAWVHKVCILRWVHEHEKFAHFSPTACPQCLTRFKLIPEKSLLISALELYFVKVVPWAKLAAGYIIFCMALDTFCIFLGFYTLSQIYSVDEVLEMTQMALQAPEPYDMAIQAQVVSYAVLAVCGVPWEDKLLRGLQCMSKLPLIRWTTPSYVPRRYYIERGGKSLDRWLVDAALLPFCANIVGRVFFSGLESRVHRFLFGGFLYLFVKGGLYMYCEHSLLRRRQQLSVRHVGR